MTEDPTIFTVEQEVFERAQSVLDDPQYQHNPLMEEFALLFHDYARMFEQFRRLIKISDSQQLQLKQAYETIDEQKHELERQNQELLEASRLREDVEHITRHDLKSPLATILSVPSFLRRNPHLTGREVQYLKRLEEAGVKMLQMINLSLDLFKMERGMYQLRPGPVNIVQVVKQIAVEMCSLQLKKRLSFQILLAGKPVDQNDSLGVHGEELLCYTLLSNLIKNALEASPKKECVTIDLEGDGQTVIIRIRNKGMVPEPIRDRFFEKYTTSGKTKGTGLGTYSAKLIADTQQGSISMTTTEEEGTVLTVRLPKSEATGPIQSYFSGVRNLPEYNMMLENLDRSLFEAVNMLPQHIVDDLRDAVAELNIHTVNTIIEQIRQHNTSLAEFFTVLARDYRFDQLETFFEQE